MIRYELQTTVEDGREMTSLTPEIIREAYFELRIGLVRSCFQTRPVLHFTMTTLQVVGGGRGIHSDCLFPRNNSGNYSIFILSTL